MMDNHHFLLLSFPFQGHVNPSLRLANKLTHAGARVTFATTVSGLNNFKNRPSLQGLSYDAFSDGYDDDSRAVEKPDYFQQTKLAGTVSLKKLLLTKAKEGQKVDFIIYGIGLSWVAVVACEFHLPSAVFFFQSAASFSLVYHCFKGDGGLVNSKLDHGGTVEVPGLPLLRYEEVPSFCRPTDALATLFKEHIQILEKYPNPMVILNTFDALEEETIKAISVGINVFSVGPLMDVITDSDPESTYLRWLDSKPEKSVVYLSFGSILKFNQKQNDEIFQGLIESGHPFLWVLRNNDEEVKRYMAEDRGLIVSWCSQVEVLNHAAIGCFVTHGGWNSMVESMVSGVAVIGWPQFADQMLNVKMADEVWENGVKVVADGDGVVGTEEFKRCLATVMSGGEITRNSEKIKSMAVEAVADGGSSHCNFNKLLQSFKCASASDFLSEGRENGKDGILGENGKDGIL